MIRAAESDDAAGINAVYNPFILESAATFETDPISDTDRRAWIGRLTADPRHPVIVAEEGGVISGFANAAPFDLRPAYGTSVKTSVFVSPECSAKGVGRGLYSALFEAMSGVDVHRAYALIVEPNAASVALHEAFGFAHISTLNDVGRKFGRYHSVMWLEKRL